MNDNRIRRYGLSPHFIALRGSQSSCNHFPSSWKFVRPDHLAFEHKPCGADLSQVPAWADSSHTKSGGGSTPRYVSFTPWGSGTSASDRHWAENIRSAGHVVSEIKSMWGWWISMSARSAWDFAEGYLCTSLSKFLSLWLQGRRRQDWLVLAWYSPQGYRYPRTDLRCHNSTASGQQTPHLLSLPFCTEFVFQKQNSCAQQFS